MYIFNVQNGWRGYPEGTEAILIFIKENTQREKHVQSYTLKSIGFWGLSGVRGFKGLTQPQNFSALVKLCPKENLVVKVFFLFNLSSLTAAWKKTILFFHWKYKTEKPTLELPWRCVAKTPRSQCREAGSHPLSRNQIPHAAMKIKDLVCLSWDPTQQNK